MTLAEWAAAASAALTAAGRDDRESRQDVSVLARARLGWSAATWLAHQRDELPPEIARDLAPLVERRKRGEPVAYLTGEREFYGRVFRVTPNVLVPRPETELIVDEAIATLPHVEPTGGRPVVIDVGTGSGVLAITIALEYPAARVTATDISARALDVAHDNARRLGAADSVEFRFGSLLAGLPGPVDMIVSNPPYIAETDRASLPIDVVRYEPASALFAGADGLDVIRGLVAAAAWALRPGGRLIMEIGFGQEHAVRRVIDATPGLDLCGVRGDLQQIPRVVVAERHAGSL